MNKKLISWVQIEKIIFCILTFSTFFILIYNILYYTPQLGYDADDHYMYVDIFSRYLPYKIVLPSINETREYFNPPLGYFIPSISQVLCRNIIDSQNFLKDCYPIIGRSTQIFQSLLYLLIIFINLKTLKIINKSSKLINISYILLLSMLSVNYKTISMIRGEIYIVFFLSIFLYLILKASEKNFNLTFKDYLYLGLSIGGIALSRQWGFLLFPPLFLLYFSNFVSNKKGYLKFLTFSFLTGFLSSGWFYINLFIKNGSFIAFNMERSPFSFSNKPLSFYLPTFEDLNYLFYKPIRPHLDNQFISILYSDLWGDYWGYFSFTSRYLDIGRNQLQIGDYLANVNKVSLITTFLLFIFYFSSLLNNKKNFLIKYVNFSVVFSLIGYLLFTISYPEGNGDTVKAVYMIQLFHLIIFVSSIYFEKLKETNFRFYIFSFAILFSIYFYNFQTYLSHFPYSIYKNL